MNEREERSGAGRIIMEWSPREAILSPNRRLSEGGNVSAKQSLQARVLSGQKSIQGFHGSALQQNNAETEEALKPEPLHKQTKGRPCGKRRAAGREVWVTAVIVALDAVEMQ
ncbi:hypothetical protein J6590_082489 [Homalodisca vitripennis]|nr:hypothetical protein J6590_082489 [Homalodisca vitripennis]